MNGAPGVNVATVLPDVTGLDKTFDYLVPDHLGERVIVGSMVRVPLAGRRIGGWVLGLATASEEVALDRLVPIAKWSGHGPASDVIDLAGWAARRWGVGRLRPLLVSASPSRMVPALVSVRRVPFTHAVPAAIVVGLLLEVLKYINLATWPWFRVKLYREYGTFMHSVAIVLWSFLASMLLLAGAEWAARRREAQRDVA